MVFTEYKRSSLRAFHLRSKIRRLVTSSNDDVIDDVITPPLTPNSTYGNTTRKVSKPF